MRLDARELADAADGHGVGGGGVRHAGPGHPGVELSLKQSRKIVRLKFRIIIFKSQES